MRDVFFTILVVWVLWRIVSSFQRVNKTRKENYGYGAEARKKEGEITIDKVPKEGHNNSEDDKGEYVDYEEIKNE